MSEQAGIREMYTLKTIAETLNTSNDLGAMMDTVVGKLLELTGLTAGWVFLIGERGSYQCISDEHVPPALKYRGGEPMRCGTCWCVNRFWDGRLDYAVNILNCKRLENAALHAWGDTQGITHHATIPLRSGEKLLGLLNVAAPGKAHFSDSELALLQAVAYQIGSALERMRLYRAEQRRADLYSKLGEFGNAMGQAVNGAAGSEKLLGTAIRLIGKYYDWPLVLFLVREREDSIIQADYVRGSGMRLRKRLLLESEADMLLGMFERETSAVLSQEEIAAIGAGCALEAALPQLKAGAVAPVTYGASEEKGVLIIGRDTLNDDVQADREVLEALADHIGTAWEGMKLAEQRRELARLEERNRLARDLHDSVNQMLFSLSLTAQGAESMLPDSPEWVLIRDAMQDIRTLSRQALREMRALILQLRPAGLERGMLEALREYGTGQGLIVSASCTGMRSMPRSIEEGLWRIGQEALNNVRKHAGVSAVDIRLELDTEQVMLMIKDKGNGGAKRRGEQPPGSLGLSIMRERAESLGGRLELTSSTRKGTSVKAVIPLPPEPILSQEEHR